MFGRFARQCRLNLIVRGRENDRRRTDSIRRRRGGLGRRVLLFSCISGWLDERARTPRVVDWNVPYPTNWRAWVVSSAAYLRGFVSGSSDRGRRSYHRADANRAVGINRSRTRNGRRRSSVTQFDNLADNLEQQSNIVRNRPG